MLFGVEPTAGIALKMLGIQPSAIPRFRDAFSLGMMTPILSL